MDMDMGQYLEIFIDESKEHLQDLNECLLELEKTPGDMDILNEIFRVAHTLKGMAGTMGFSKMSKLTHDMENVLQEIRNGNISINTYIVDILFKCLDALEQYLNNIIDTSSEGDYDSSSIISMLNSVLDGEPKSNIATTDKPEASKGKDDDFVIDEYVQNVVNKAIKAGMNAYKILVRLNKACVLKSARAFLVFKTLENSSEIIKSKPEVEDIEDEKFDLEFKLAIVSKDNKENLLKQLNSIAEIDEVIINDLQQKQIDNSMKESLNNSNNIIDKQPVKSATTKKTTNNVGKHKTGKTVRVDINRLDNLMNLVSELIIIKTRLEDIEGNGKNQNYNEAVEYLERITTNLHDAVMKVRMVPVEMVFNRFPRMIRDLCKQLNKKIVLNMYGSETEVDRTVIDEIGEPLIHLLRNSADHGIETPEERKKENKSETGVINLRAYHDGNNVVIEVEDDGKGIDIDKVRDKAIKAKFIDENMADSLSKKEIIKFLFKPSFSTADKISNVSGRGVGLDVVKTKIEALGGIIEVETEKEEGTKFIIRLPLTLAIIQALMVTLGKEKYAIPLSSIKEIINVNANEIKLVQKQEVILVRDTVIPLVRLNKILNVPENKNANKNELTVVIIKKGGKFSGFIVDDLIGQQEIVIKSIGKHLSGIKDIAGATILGDGQVALILDVNSLAL